MSWGGKVSRAGDVVDGARDVVALGRAGLDKRDGVARSVWGEIVGTFGEVGIFRRMAVWNHH